MGSVSLLPWPDAKIKASPGIASRKYREFIQWGAKERKNWRRGLCGGCCHPVFLIAGLRREYFKKPCFPFISWRCFMDEFQINFIAKNDNKSTSPHTVEVLIKNRQMFIHCDCPAGKFGKFCMHKIRLLQDDHQVLHDQSQRNELNRISNWIHNSDFLDLIFERSSFKKELREAEDRLEAIKRNMKPVEDKMAQAMKIGINAVNR